MNFNKKYIIRLDDACPTMERTKWDTVEKLLDTFNIKPLVAVIPNNKSPEYFIHDYDDNFWQKVKSWQEKGWNIALHGYEHLYSNRPFKAILPINNYTEFSGLTVDEQYEKIQNGLEIFIRHSINTAIWVAPAHTFDLNTLKALKKAEKISMISDGIAFYPYTKNGFLWIPQQIWTLQPKKWGIWTACFHPNIISEKRISALHAFLERHSDEFINDLNDLLPAYKQRRRNVLDYLFFCSFFLSKYFSRKQISATDTGEP